MGSAVDGESGHPLRAYGRWCQQNSLLRLVAMGVARRDSGDFKVFVLSNRKGDVFFS